MRDRRCGRSGVLSPFRLTVPYSFQIRAALWFAVSMATRSSPKTVARTSSACFTRSRDRSSFGSSTRYRRWAPFPESAMTGSGHPIPLRWSATRSAVSKAAWCSSSVEETPDGRTGSMSTGNHRRARMSVSDVVASFLPSRVLIRFARREWRAGFTSFKVT